MIYSNETYRAWGEVYLNPTHKGKDPHTMFAKLVNLPRQQAKELALKIYYYFPFKE